MLAIIIIKEVRDIIGSTKFATTFGVCALLILLSFYVGAKNYQLSQARYEAARAENIKQMEGLTDWFSLEQHRIFLPPQPLAALTTGIVNDIGRTTEVKNRGELTAHDSKFNEDPIYAVFRFLDLQFVFLIVLSLFAILLGYDAVCGEKEQGTLRLSFANAVPRATYIIGKLIGSFLTLSASLMVAILLGCLLLPLMGVPMNGGDWTRLFLIILCGLLYFGAFLALSVFVSTLSHRTSSAFLVLLVIWISAVMIVPRVSVLLAARAVPVPSVDEIGAQKASLSSQLWSDFKKDMAGFRAPESTDPEEMMNVFNRFVDTLTAERDKKMNELTSRLNEDRYNRQRQQEIWAFNLARLSPAASLIMATSTLAGTSIDLKNRYHDAASEYQQTFNAFMKEKTGMNVGGRMIMFKVKTGEEEEPPEPIDPRELPAFAMAAPSPGEVLGESVTDLGLLALFNLIFFAGACISFSRYDVR